MANLQSAGQMSLNKMCEGCKRNAPQVYCECSGSRVYLCESCIGSHIGKNAGLRHELIPAAAEVTNMTAYRERSEVLTAGKRELELTLAKIDQCCEELTAAVEGIVWTLTKYLEDQITQMRALKATLSADIAESVNEAQSMLSQEEVHCVGKYSQYLRRYEKDNLILFDYQIRPNLAKLCLQLMPNFALLEPGQYRPRLVLVNLRSDRVQKFNFQKETWYGPTLLSKAIKIDGGSSYTRVNETQVFYCGFSENTVESMRQADGLVDISSGAVDELPPLSIARRGPGVLHHEGKLFVFGSNAHADYHLNPATNAAIGGVEVEMLELTGQQWSRLPSMPHGRSYFTPCVYSGNAYLCISNDVWVDVFKLSTQTFLSSLPIKIPRELYSGAVTIVHGDELIVITNNNTTTFNLLLSTTNSQSHSKIDAQAISTPVECENLVYWVNLNLKVIRASGNKYDVIEIVGK